MKALLDNKSAYSGKGILSLPPRSPRSELPFPAIRPRLVSWANAHMRKSNTHMHKHKKMFKGLFVMLERWNGQAWAVTLDHPWLCSPLTRTWGSSISRPRCRPNVTANAHLASVASAKPCAAWPRSLAAPAAARPSLQPLAGTLFVCR